MDSLNVYDKSRARNTHLAQCVMVLMHFPPHELVGHQDILNPETNAEKVPTIFRDQAFTAELSC